MNPVLSNQWLQTYYGALQLCWNDAEFQVSLMADPRGALEKKFNFTYPAVLDLQFKYVPDGNFSALPEFPISIFDYPPAVQTALQVPLVPPPPSGLTDLNYLMGLQTPAPACCCMCF